MDWIVENFGCSLATLVESAEPGRNEELSFFWTSASLPWNEPPPSPMSRNSTARAPNTHTTRGRRARSPVVSGASSINVIASSCGSRTAPGRAYTRCVHPYDCAGAANSSLLGKDGIGAHRRFAMGFHPDMTLTFVMRAGRRLGTV